MDLCKQPGVFSTRMPLVQMHSCIRNAPFAPRRQQTIQQFVRPEPEPKLLSSRNSFETYRIVPVTFKDVHSVYSKKHQTQHPEMTSEPSTQPRELLLHEKQKMLHVMQQLFFECEYHLLVKYVECAVPMMYAIYVAVLQQLPSAEYYPETQGLNSSQSQAIVLNIMLYAGLEILLLLALYAVIKKRCGFSATYLLAFVLENQALELQSRLFLWYIFLLQFTLAHFGMIVARCDSRFWYLTKYALDTLRGLTVSTRNESRPMQYFRGGAKRDEVAL